MGTLNEVDQAISPIELLTLLALLLAPVISVALTVQAMVMKKIGAFTRRRWLAIAALVLSAPAIAVLSVTMLYLFPSLVRSLNPYSIASYVSAPVVIAAVAVSLLSTAVVAKLTRR